MAEAETKQVNTTAAGHPPVWTRKQRVDGAQNKPTATSGTHGHIPTHDRRPHNARRPQKQQQRGQQQQHGHSGYGEDRAVCHVHDAQSIREADGVRN